MNPKWTQKEMAKIAAEEREALGLGLMDPLDPYVLAEEWGIPVYPITALVDDGCPDETIEHFQTTSSKRWSAALVPVGRSRIDGSTAGSATSASTAANGTASAHSSTSGSTRCAPSTASQTSHTSQHARPRYHNPEPFSP